MLYADGLLARGGNLCHIAELLLGCKRTYDETKVVVVAEGLVINKRTALATAGTTKAGYLGIKVQVCAIALGQLIDVGCLGELLLAPRQGRN